MSSAAAADSDCSHVPLGEDGLPIMRDVTHEPQGVGVELSPDSRAVKVSKVVFLGTGSAIPSPGRRNTSAIAVMLNNSSNILMDCGEATQHQIMKSQSVSFSKIASILITHLHGDHCYGLFGLLSTVASQGRTEPVLLVGPRGLRNMVTTVLAASGGFACFDLRFLELETGKSYPDLGLINGGVRLQAYPLRHRVASFGYVLTEGLKPGPMLVDKAKELGAQGKELRLLKEGKDVTLADGRVVHSVDCVGPPVRARSIALLQDTFDSSAALAACADVDMLIHECTYSASMRTKAIEHGHSTSAMCGEFAAQARANMVVMTHFSNRYDTTEQTARRLAAKAAAAAAAPVAEMQALNVAIEPPASACAASSSAAAVPAADVLTLAELCAEALAAYCATNPNGSGPPGGVHAAEDFMAIDSKLETFIVAPQKDRVFANELLAAESRD